MRHFSNESPFRIPGSLEKKSHIAFAALLRISGAGLGFFFFTSKVKPQMPSLIPQPTLQGEKNVLKGRNVDML